MYIFIDRRTRVGRFVLSLGFTYIDMNRSLLWFSACFYNKSAYIFLYEKTLNVRWLHKIMPSLYDVAACVFLNEKLLNVRSLHTMMLLHTFSLMRKRWMWDDCTQLCHHYTMLLHMFFLMRNSWMLDRCILWCCCIHFSLWENAECEITARNYAIIICCCCIYFC